MIYLHFKACRVRIGEKENIRIKGKMKSSVGKESSVGGCFAWFGCCCCFSGDIGCERGDNDYEHVAINNNPKSLKLQGANVCDGRDSNELMK